MHSPIKALKADENNCCGVKKQKQKNTKNESLTISQLKHVGSYSSRFERIPMHNFFLFFHKFLVSEAHADVNNKSV